MDAAENPALPLDGLTVVEFTHMVMGPVVGLILADLGATVIKVEPLGGDKTRRLPGSGAGYFPMYNRNKRSIELDTSTPEGQDEARALCKRADIVVENFRPGAMDKRGLGYADLRKDNPGVIYCSLKGFLEGPYSHRTALDEVTQMMGGLAYMTGLPGRPMRAGASVIDVTGGMFGVIGVLAALERRRRTGEGEHVQSALFETTAFLVGQHMAQFAVSKKPLQPMSVRTSAWAVYDAFQTRDGEQLFVAVVSDTQWPKFCHAFGLDTLAADTELATNADRVRRREEILPVIRAALARFDKAELMERLDQTGLPFAPINRPEDLIDDPHLNAGGLYSLTLSDGSTVKLPALPVSFGESRPPLRHDLPPAGEGNDELRG